MSETKKSLPFQLGEITNANIQQLRTLNMKTLPVRYSDMFYRALLAKYGNDYMKFAFWNGFVCAAVCARVEVPPLGEPNENNSKLYIMTINVLAAYRKHGIGMCTFVIFSVIF